MPGRGDVSVVIPALNEEPYLPGPLDSLGARRFESEGVLRQSARWLGIELHRIFRGEIRGEYFRYFG